MSVLVVGVPAPPPLRLRRVCILRVPPSETCVFYVSRCRLVQEGTEGGRVRGSSPVSRLVAAGVRVRVAQGPQGLACVHDGNTCVPCPLFPGQLRLRCQDLGLKAHLDQLDQRISELQLDMHRTPPEGPDGDSRPSSGTCHTQTQAHECACVYMHTTQRHGHMCVHITHTMHT